MSNITKDPFSSPIIIQEEWLLPNDISVDYFSEAQQKISAQNSAQFLDRYRQLKRIEIGIDEADLKQLAEIINNIFESISNGTILEPCKKKIMGNRFSLIADPYKKSIYIDNQSEAASGTYKIVKKIIEIPEKISSNPLFFVKKKLLSEVQERELQSFWREIEIQEQLGFPRTFDEQRPSHLLYSGFKNSSKKKLIQIEPFFPAILQKKDLEDFESALSIVLQLIKQLKEIHSKKIIHGDIKNANILLDSSPLKTPCVSFTDFGFFSEYDKSQNKIRLNWVIQNGYYGSIRYTAPELLGNFGSCDFFQVEVYALGYILHELLFPQSTHIHFKFPEQIFKVQKELNNQSDELLELEKKLANQHQKLHTEIQKISDDIQKKKNKIKIKKTGINTVKKSHIQITTALNENRISRKVAKNKQREILREFRKRSKDQDSLIENYTIQIAQKKKINGDLKIIQFHITKNNESIEEFRQLEQPKGEWKNNILNLVEYRESLRNSYNSSISHIENEEKNPYFQTLKMVILGMMHPNHTQRLSLEEASRLLQTLAKEYAQRKIDWNDTLLLRR